MRKFCATEVYVSYIPYRMYFVAFGYVEFSKFIGEIYFLLLIYYQYNRQSAHTSALNTACSLIEGGTALFALTSPILASSHHTHYKKSREIKTGLHALFGFRLHRLIDRSMNI